MMAARKVIAVLLLGVASSAVAGIDDGISDSLRVVAATAATELAEGEVRKVDKAAGKLTIRHGPIKHLDMPAMTMVFQVKTASALDQLKTGDKVKFAVENSGGAYVVTHIEPSK